MEAWRHGNGHIFWRGPAEAWRHEKFSILPKPDILFIGGRREKGGPAEVKTFAGYRGPRSGVGVQGTGATRGGGGLYKFSERQKQDRLRLFINPLASDCIR